MIKVTDVNRRLIALIPMTVPAIMWRQNEIARTECNVLSLDCREVCRSGEAEAHRVGRMTMRGCGFVGKINAISRIHGRDCCNGRSSPGFIRINVRRSESFMDTSSPIFRRRVRLPSTSENIFSFLPLNSSAQLQTTVDGPRRGSAKNYPAAVQKASRSITNPLGFGRDRCHHY